MAAPSAVDAPQERKLTKAQKKALAFRDRAKGKGKAPKAVLNEEDAVPEEEDLAALEAAGGEEGEKASKKRKRAREDDGEGEKEKGEKDGAEGAEGAEEQPKKKKRQRGKTPAQRAREAREKEQIGEGGAAAASGASRLLLFVGNLPYKVTVEEIQKHFEPCGEKPTVRLLTPKTPSTGATPQQSKGCAFLEFLSPTSLQLALRMHQSSLPGHPRKINVELTAGGGGNSAARKAKIEEQRKKLTGEREKAAKNKRLREGESEDGDKTGRWRLAAAKQAAAAGIEGGEASSAPAAAATTGGEGDKPKKKVRDRRLKNASATSASSAPPAAPANGTTGGGKKSAAKEPRLPKASTGANAIKLASGWGNKAAK